jgi:hypothetical protein
VSRMFSLGLLGAHHEINYDHALDPEIYLQITSHIVQN